MALRGSNAASPVVAQRQRRRCQKATPLCRAYDLQSAMELIETVGPKLARRLESLKAEIPQDQSTGAADEDKVK